MSTAHRYVPHYTVADYARWDGQWQLIEGVPIAMTPSPFARHERIVMRFAKLFGVQIDEQGCDCEVYGGLDWIVSGDTVVRPDCMVVCGEQPQRHLERAPAIVVEVLSPSTAELDRVTKRRIYSEQGVAWYVIVDGESNTMEILQFEGGEEVSRQEIGIGESAALQLADGRRFHVDAERVFR